MTKDEMVTKVAAMLLGAYDVEQKAKEIVEALDLGFGAFQARLEQKLQDKRAEVLSLRELVEKQQKDGAMRILPHLSSGIPFLQPDNKTVVMLPFQVMLLESGMTVIRLGNNALFFDGDGKFDGGECKPTAIKSPDSPEALAIAAAFRASEANEGRAPAEPYFMPSSHGYKSEIAFWPKDPTKN